MKRTTQEQPRHEPPADTSRQAQRRKCFTRTALTRQAERDWPLGSTPAREHHQWTPLARALLATGDRWTLLIAAALAAEPLRLSELRPRLPGISTGVLDRHLQQMVDLGLIVRRRYRELPPRVEYELTRAGGELVPLAIQLARWGARHMWTEPQPREHVAIGEFLRLLPAMLAGAQLPDGTIELIVQQPPAEEGPSLREQFIFEVHGERLERVERRRVKAILSMAGSPEDWVLALGPGRDVTALALKGDRVLAGRLLDLLLG